MGAPVKWGAAGLLTVEKAVVLEAASAEQRVEGVQALLTLHRASVGPVDVRRALGGQRTRQLLLRQLFIPDTQNTESRHTQRNPSPPVSCCQPGASLVFSQQVMISGKRPCCCVRNIPNSKLTSL